MKCFAVWPHGQELLGKQISRMFDHQCLMFRQSLSFIPKITFCTRMAIQIAKLVCFETFAHRPKLGPVSVQDAVQDETCSQKRHIN